MTTVEESETILEELQQRTNAKNGYETIIESIVEVIQRLQAYPKAKTME